VAYNLTDFNDIQDMVMEELKHSSGDTAELARIKRDINAVYLEEVVPFKRWKWLFGSTNIIQPPYINDGTCTVTPASATVTLTVAPAASKAGYFFSVEGYEEVFIISAHTAASTTVTLSTTYTGALNTTASYRIWTNKIVLPTSLRETLEVTHDFHANPLEPLGLQEFRKRSAEAPKLTGRPYYYTTYDYEDPTPLTGETESDRYRVMLVYPAIDQYSTTLHIDYIAEATVLDLDADEPLMPREDRIVLVYGALERAWRRARNPEEAANNRALFERKLGLMAGRVEDSYDKPQLSPDSLYLSRKRKNGIRSLTARSAFAGGAGYTAPTYLSGATINGANVTAAITVNSGVTIDGRDLSVDGAALDALGVLANGYIYVGNASNVAAEVQVSGDITLSNAGVAAIVAGVIVNADVNASAAIAKSKLAAGTVSMVEVTDASGYLTESAVTASELTFLSNVEPLTTATLADNTASAANVATWVLATYDSIFIEYSFKRGSSIKEVGSIRLATDGTNASIAQGVISSIGTNGVTLTADVSAGTLRLRYTTTSTGTAVTMKYKAQKWLA
jgi:hypothetical protein